MFYFRLFNDPVCMMFLYAAINAFADNRWSLGSLLFSLAVSVKVCFKSLLTEAKLQINLVLILIQPKFVGEESFGIEPIEISVYT